MPLPPGFENVTMSKRLIEELEQMGIGRDGRPIVYDMGEEEEDDDEDDDDDDDESRAAREINRRRLAEIREEGE